MFTYQKQRGFNLVELVVVTAIIGILASAAVPAWKSFVQRNERSVITGQLISAFNMARTAAINKNTSITICPVDTNNKCSDDWSSPITIFYDPQRARKIMNSDSIVTLINPPQSGHLLVQSGNRKYFGFRSNGMAQSAIGNIRWCPENNIASEAIQLRINMGGRIQTAQDHNGDGIVDDSNGDSISCT